MTNRVQELIETLALSPHPEGGYFSEVYRSTDTVVSRAANAERSAVTDIYFLLTKGQVSRFHKVCHDEIWHFYEGAPLALLDMSSDLLSVQTHQLGRVNPICFKHCVVAENWQAARTSGDYSLVGCTVAPGFDFADFSFLSDDPVLTEQMRSKHPALAQFI